MMLRSLLRRQIAGALFLGVLILPLVVNNVIAAGFEEDIDAIRVKLSQKIEAAQLKNIAVIDFTDVHSNVTELGRFVAEELSTSMVLTPNNFSVIDRSHLKYILNEQKLSISGLMDPKNTIKIGKLAGVDALVLGTITPFGDNVRLTVKVLDTKTAHLVTGARATIAKTKAIDELLSREVMMEPMGGGSEQVSGGSVRRSFKPSVFTSNGLEFRAVKLLVGKDQATFILSITNKGEKDQYLWLLQTDDGCSPGNFDTFLYASSGTEGRLRTVPGIGVFNDGLTCDTAGAVIEKGNQTRVTFSFALAGSEKSIAFDFSSTMYLSEDPNDYGKRLAVTLTDLRPVK